MKKKTKIFYLLSFLGVATLLSGCTNFFEKESPERLLKRLVHELIHMNLDNEEQIKRGRNKNEELVKSITENVWRNLNLK